MDLLRTNPNWNTFMNEYEGVFVLDYVYRGIHFILYNQVGGQLFITTTWDTVSVAQANMDVFDTFTRVAKEFFLNQ